MPAVKPGMIGVFGQTHIELDNLIDLKSFDDIQIDIWKGMALSKFLSMQGSLSNIILDEDMSYKYYFKPLFKAYNEYQLLPLDDIVKVTGEELRQTNRNSFVTFLKYAYGAHDLYTIYNFWNCKPGWKNNPSACLPNEILNYFPSLIQWIENLITVNVFTHIGRAYIVALESGGISFEHRDNLADPESQSDTEFIHIRPNLKRPFYVYNPVTNEKHYVQSRIAWWNDKDVHGGDSVTEPSYAIRIDGVFTDEFRNSILNEI